LDIEFNGHSYGSNQSVAARIGVKAPESAKFTPKTHWDKRRYFYPRRVSVLNDG
jgi:hypothetical protein